MKVQLNYDLPHRSQVQDVPDGFINAWVYASRWICEMRTAQAYFEAPASERFASAALTCSG
jgi:hypothetical protein